MNPTNPKMEFCDLAAQQRRIKERIDQNIQKVLAHNQYIMGPEIKELEQKLAAYVGAKHAIGCASGTDALLMALMAYGIGPGDAIFTPPFTFIATAEVISLLGAMPVFVDIDPLTYNIDPDKLALAIRAVEFHDPCIYPFSPNSLPLTPRGVIAVDLYGLPADYDSISKVAKDSGLFVIEDAAQSFGGEYKGNKACSCGEIGCTSFFPSKPFGCYGDGGMCFTADDHLAEVMRSVRVHGQGSHKYENVRIGINGRLDTLQAAILLAKWEIFAEEIELRQQVVKGYTELIGQNPSITTPQVPAGYKSAWAQYSILAENDAKRSALIDKLKTADIPTAIHYPKPLHLQSAYASLGYTAGAFPVSEDVANRIFSLPMHPYLTTQDQEKIAAALK